MPLVAGSCYSFAREITQRKSPALPLTTTLSFLACFSLMLPLASPARAQSSAPEVIFTPLPLPSNYSGFVYTKGISEDGSVVAGYADLTEGQNNYAHALRWENGQFVKLGTLPYNWGTPASYAHGVSGDGKVVVGVSDFGYGFQAFRWENGQMVGLGSLSGYPDYHGSLAYGASRDGKVIVGNSGSPGGVQAFRWENGQMVGLGWLQETQDRTSTASFVSGDGKVIVGESSSPSEIQTFRWENGQMVGLGFLPGHHISYANGMSDTGRVIVGSSSASSGRQAFRWENGQMVRLDFLPLREYNTAFGVSGDGQVVVGESDESGFPPAFWLWRSDLGVVRLEELVRAHNVVGMEGWTLFRIRTISADGSTIVGEATHPVWKTAPFTLRATGPGGFRALGYKGHAVLGRVQIQGISATAAARTITFELRPTGGGQPITFTQSVSAAREDQSFTLPVPAGQSGSFHLAIKGEGYLRTVVPLQVSAAGGVAVPDITLLAGDLNNDNRINLTDLVMLRANYGKTGADLKGDLNGDGRVNLTDLVMLRANYDQTGAP